MSTGCEVTTILTELIILLCSRNRPLIDPNPSYSSPGDPISEDRRQPSSDVEYFAEDIVPVVLTIDVSLRSSLVA